MDKEFNPYLSPQSDTSIGSETAELYVDGSDLLCRTGTTLPARCIKTNEPIGQERLKPKVLYWMNPWLYLLILVNLLVLVIVHFCVRKRVQIAFGLSRAARRDRTLKLTAAYTLFFISFCALMLGIVLESMVISAACVLGLILSLLWLAKIGPLIRVRREVPGGFFALRGCCPEFLASIEQERFKQTIPGGL